MNIFPCCVSCLHLSHTLHLKIKNIFIYILYISWLNLSVSLVPAWLYLCSRGCHTWIAPCWYQVEDALDWLKGTPSKTVLWDSTQHVLSEGIPGLLHSLWQKSHLSVREYKGIYLIERLSKIIILFSNTRQHQGYSERLMVPIIIWNFSTATLWRWQLTF